MQKYMIYKYDNIWYFAFFSIVANYYCCLSLPLSFSSLLASVFIICIVVIIAVAIIIMTIIIILIIIIITFPIFIDLYY